MLNYKHPGPLRILIAALASLLLFTGLAIARPTEAHAAAPVWPLASVRISTSFWSILWPSLDGGINSTSVTTTSLDVESITPSETAWPNTPITVTFSSNVNQAIAEQKIQITPQVGGVFEWVDGRTVKFWPWQQGDDTSYVVQVAAGVPSAFLSHIKTTESTEISYKTRNFPGSARTHRVAKTRPLDDKNVAPNSPITVVFSHPVIKSEAEKHFHLAPKTAGTFSWRDDHTMVFTPKDQVPDRRYSYEITKGVPWLANPSTVTGAGLVVYYEDFVDKTKKIVIDLSQQTLYAYEGKRLIFSDLVSTGLSGTPTPIGSFRIYRKVPVKAYVGPGYYLPNTHWNAEFYRAAGGGYYIHEAWWHNNFGRPMSHGCVNMRLSSSKFIYDWAPIGTPVQVRW